MISSKRAAWVRMASGDTVRRRRLIAAGVIHHCMMRYKSRVRILEIPYYCKDLFNTCAFEGDGVNHGSECLLDVRCATDGGAAYDEARYCGISVCNTFGVDGGFASGSINDCFRLLQGLSTFGQLGGVRGKYCKDIGERSAEDAIVCNAADSDCRMQDERCINGATKGGRIE